ncbi:Gfo/Idh/MocA family oxidoreductase [Frankia sp. Cr2]|uniref:Gfo/Idh/MocA family protein n=1 Tax=Frankia sp. Cr2 TaxID=3073932 RepID=UPI002AD239BD|nr:Gfo/Idh/MocA family oxidoreductase [Frankia sp. Cr2]
MRVGLVGCGRIGGSAHVAAYLQAGMRVTAVCDYYDERAKRVASRLGAAVEKDAVRLAAREDVDLVDVATPPGTRAELLSALFEVGKPVLAQKPLAYDLATAQSIVDEADSKGVPLAVNQNARWAPTHLVLFRWIESGDAGSVYAVHHHNRYREDVDTWYTRHPDYIFLDHGIHYFDLVRLLAQETPSAVSAVSGRRPGQVAASPLLYSVNTRFSSGTAPHVAMTFVNSVPGPSAYDYRLVVDGTRQSAVASLSAVDVYSGEQEKRIVPKGEWVPDGFTGALVSFVRHLRGEGPLPHAGRDHLRSLAVAAAAAKSASLDGEWVDVVQGSFGEARRPALADYLF